MPGGERGMTLLEVIVALSLLAGVGTAFVAAFGGALRSEDQLRRREMTLLDGDRVLTAMTLLTRNELDQRLGHHPAGEFIVAVQRPEPALYRIAISEAAVPDVEMLVTVVYRPGPVSP